MFGIPLHKLIIHFPIALTLAALMYDAWASYSKRPQLHAASYGLTLWASASALAAVVSGLQMASAAGLMRAATGHAGLGITGCVVLVGLGFMRYSVRARGDESPNAYRQVWLLMLIVAAILISAAAITGHRLFGG